MAGAADAGPEPARRRRRRRALTETGVMILVAVLLAAWLRAFVFQTFFIPSSSMVPTLGVYDRILVQKAFFNWHDVRDGDIVVFAHPPLDHCPGPQQATWSSGSSRCPGRRSTHRATTSTSTGGCCAEPYLPHHDPLGPPIPNASSQHPSGSRPASST